jgi:hypothetical protein
MSDTDCTLGYEECDGANGQCVGKTCVPTDSTASGNPNCNTDTVPVYQTPCSTDDKCAMCSTTDADLMCGTDTNRTEYVCSTGAAGQDAYPVGACFASECTGVNFDECSNINEECVGGSC